MVSCAEFLEKELSSFFSFINVDNGLLKMLYALH